jgi:hypothetical protein
LASPKSAMRKYSPTSRFADSIYLSEYETMRMSSTYTSTNAMQWAVHCVEDGVRRRSFEPEGGESMVETSVRTTHARLVSAHRCS